MRSVEWAEKSLPWIFVEFIRTVVFAVAHLVQVNANAGDIRAAPLIVDLARRHELFAGVYGAVLIFALIAVRISIANWKKGHLLAFCFFDKIVSLCHLPQEAKMHFPSLQRKLF